jgi:phosphate ABC transporter phosphate-binding protein
VNHRLRAAVTAVGVLLVGLLGAAPAAAESFVPVNGAGSSWSSNAVDQWRRNVEQYGMRINYASTGSSDGRNQFKAGTVDFAITEIPYGLKDGGVVDTPPTRGFVYLPIVAGGTAFMYNLTSGGKRITNLRLSGEAITGIFTGTITTWDDPLIADDNPSLQLPKRKIVPVVRSDGSGSTAQFATWMASQHRSAWDAYCRAAGRSTPCGVTSTYPVIPGRGFVAQPNSQGVAGYVAQTGNEGTITYVEYSYALKTGYPVAKVLNSADYFVEPTASNVAVGLLGARINTDEGSPSYLTQDLTGVFTNRDDRTYPLSSYSYIVVPTGTENGFTTAKGYTLGAFANYFLCEGQQQAEVLGYSPLPINLVKAGMEQIVKIPGSTTVTTDIAKCNNPTFSSDGGNTLAEKAPHPSKCDHRDATEQCDRPTGGAPGAPDPGDGGDDGGPGDDGGTDGGGTGTGDDEGAGTPDDGSTTGPGSGTGTDGTGGGGGGPQGWDAVTGGGPVVCEDDTGVCTQVVSMPVETSATGASGLSPWAVVAACVLLLATVVVPPLVARSRRSAGVAA